MSRSTLGSLLTKRPTTNAVDGNSIALVFEGRSFSYGELDERAERLASGLLRAGFRAGDRCCVVLHNRPEWLELFFALAKIGGVIVPINFYLKPNEAQYIVEDSGAQWIVCEDVLWSIPEGMTVADSVNHIVIGEERPGALSYEDVVADGSADGVDIDVSADDLFLLQYTSGTTGFPKGAAHSHATVLWNSVSQVTDFDVSERDVYLITPALCWAAGFHDIALATLWVGGRLVLRPTRNFEPRDFFELVQEHGVTKVLLVPTVLKRVLTSEALKDYDLSSLTLVVSGGEPVPLTAIEQFRDQLPDANLVQVYGLSEFPSMALYLDTQYAESKAGSAGKACLAAEVRVVDGDGNDVAPGEVGEITCHSPACMVGYYGNETASKSALRGGWLHTGDLAEVDEDGFVYVKGRSKDMIISGGLNVYPAEVERVISQHPAVAEAAVVGVPDDSWGEIGKAFVVLDAGKSLAEEELSEYLRDNLATYKVPKLFEMRNEPLPRTTSGKIQKFLLTKSES